MERIDRLAPHDRISSGEIGRQRWTGTRHDAALLPLDHTGRTEHHDHRRPHHDPTFTTGRCDDGQQQSDDTRSEACQPTLGFDERRRFADHQRHGATSRTIGPMRRTQVMRLGRHHPTEHTGQHAHDDVGEVRPTDTRPDPEPARSQQRDHHGQQQTERSTVEPPRSVPGEHAVDHDRHSGRRRQAVPTAERFDDLPRRLQSIAPTECGDDQRNGAAQHDHHERCCHHLRLRLDSRSDCLGVLGHHDTDATRRQRSRRRHPERDRRPRPATVDSHRGASSLVCSARARGRDRVRLALGSRPPDDRLSPQRPGQQLEHADRADVDRRDGARRRPVTGGGAQLRVRRTLGNRRVGHDGGRPGVARHDETWRPHRVRRDGASDGGRLSPAVGARHRRPTDIGAHDERRGDLAPVHAPRCRSPASTISSTWR